MRKEEEFIALIHAHQGLIFKIASFYTSSKEEKEDLSQEIIYQVWKSFDLFQNNSKPSTWLYRIGMNTAITQLNKSKRKVTAVPLDGIQLQWIEETDSESEEKLSQLYAEIKKLNLLDKGIVLLFLEAKSHEEISDILGISVSNVGTRLSRIKEKLRKGIHTH
ncbi:RNA polymerase sigma factor [Algoriphagus sp. H41]|uniref:RNA polymerase sigma factor n=1 Tax=Algoriphagus oliviformis TaxID=2811231 RepID=A0ABS3C233_9BACT|nr:RNA polymerase sigma factor [Algoriphagus oliviformis]MBN7811183.1 RNA polymerase sigma factor [Algoriphagus oliviformis]